MAPINRITEEDVSRFISNSDADLYQEIAIKSAIYPGLDSVWGISYCAHKLAGEAGEFNEHFGKALRDDGLLEIAKLGKVRYHVTVNPLTDQRREALLKELGDCLWYISALSRELGVSLASVMLMNLRKLSSRSQRDKLQGSGDER